jgi:hypothetical protein
MGFRGWFVKGLHDAFVAMATDTGAGACDVRENHEGKQGTCDEKGNDVISTHGNILPG